MTYLELCQRLRMEAGLSGTGPASVTSQTGMDKKLVEWVRSAWEEIQLSRLDWRFSWGESSLPVLAGTASINPVLLGLSDLNVWSKDTARFDGAPLKHIGWRDFQQFKTTTTGLVAYFSEAPDRSLHFSQLPVADGTFTAEYFKTPQILASNMDVPRMPAHYHMAIVYKALMMYAAHDDAAQTFVDASMRFNQLYNKIESTEAPIKRIGVGGLDGYTG